MKELFLEYGHMFVKFLKTNNLLNNDTTDKAVSAVMEMHRDLITWELLITISHLELWWEWAAALVCGIGEGQTIWYLLHLLFCSMCISSTCLSMKSRCLNGWLHNEWTEAAMASAIAHYNLKHIDVILISDDEGDNFSEISSCLDVTLNGMNVSGNLADSDSAVESNSENIPGTFEMRWVAVYMMQNNQGCSLQLARVGAWRRLHSTHNHISRSWSHSVLSACLILQTC